MGRRSPFGSNTTMVLEWAREVRRRRRISHTSGIVTTSPLVRFGAFTIPQRQKKRTLLETRINAAKSVGFVFDF